MVQLLKRFAAFLRSEFRLRKLWFVHKDWKIVVFSPVSAVLAILKYRMFVGTHVRIPQGFLKCLWGRNTDSRIHVHCCPLIHGFTLARATNLASLNPMTVTHCNMDLPFSDTVAASSLDLSVDLLGLPLAPVHLFFRLVAVLCNREC